ncbi:AfsR/SARP family transcriptional regulator [Rugosimonospora acidiphila]|uniref:AfsR/SARP family transcriptional regulator n=1 Tax=Rugosimonospora acidiphila TaxID=556531 RepID=UPI0031ED0849
MEFRLLGPLAAVHDGRPVQLGRRRERCLLGVLLLEPNAAITIERLTDLLWDGQPPSTARASLHTHVSRLRSRLDPDGSGLLGVRLISRDGGYAVEVDPERVDAHRFSASVARAGAAGPTGRIDLLREALALWHGPVLADVATPLLRERIAARLTELRMSAIESLIDAELTGDQARDLIGELSALRAEHPHRERLAGQLMLALYRAGRPADALLAYQQLRDRLAEDLGVDPGPEVSELHTAILRRDPALAHPRATAALPRQLPAATRLFTGRVDELVALTRALVDGDDRSAPMVVTAIGGAGKTWLALRWAHQHLDRFPDGQLFVNLRGFDPSGQPTAPATAVRGFLDALGVPPAAVPVELDAQVGLYRSLLATRRMLVVLDNARDASQVVPLLPGSATCTVIVTSRDRLTGLITGHGAVPLGLDVLNEADSRELLGRRLGEERMTGEPDAVTALIGGCAGLPLALGVAASRAALAPHLPLASIAAELRDASTRLGALDEGDPQASLRAVLSWSYAALTPTQAHVFGLLGSAAGPDIGLPAAAALTGLPATEVAATLRALERQSLVQQSAPDRWRMHDLIRLYAAERAGSDQPGQQDAALRRLVDFYLHSAYAADRLLDPSRPPPPLPLADPAPGAVPHRLPDRAAALDWLDREHPCVRAAQRLALQQGRQAARWQLAWSLNTFYGWRGHLHDLVDVWRCGLAAGQRLGDPEVQALAHRYLGRACVLVGRLTEAAEHLDRSLALARRSDDLPGQARAHWTLAWAWERRGDDERALEHATRALHLYRACGDPVGEGGALNVVGWYAARLGRYGPARVHLESALTLSRRDGNRGGEADTLDSLGLVAHHTGQHAQAERYYQQALAVYRDLGNAYEEADTLERLGDTRSDAGEADRARHAWRQALRLYQGQCRTADAERVQRRIDRLDPPGEAAVRSRTAAD